MRHSKRSLGLYGLVLALPLQAATVVLLEHRALTLHPLLAVKGGVAGVVLPPLPWRAQGRLCVWRQPILGMDAPARMGAEGV